MELLGGAPKCFHKNFLLLFLFIFDIISVEREKVMKEIIFIAIGIIAVVVWLIKG
jgi:hypothetical protein